jgi:hypothetical protein
VAVEVAPSSVVVLGGAWVGVSGQDLGVAERDSGVEGVGDGCVAQGVGADVARDARGPGDPDHHPVDVAPVDGPSRERAQDQRSFGALSAASLQSAEYRDG